MNKVPVPIVTFKNIISDEKRIEAAYARLFDIARRNILARKQLTNGLTQEYTEVHNEKRIFNNRRSGQEITS